METKFDWEKAEVMRMLKGAPGTMYQEANDTEKTAMRDWVSSLLQKQPITVTFVKADGTVRDMLCTLDWDQIPTAMHPGQPPVDGIVKESKQRKQPDEHSLRVFDLEKGEWRSFRFDRLKKITAELKFE
jgi:hypothetical protein